MNALHIERVAHAFARHSAYLEVNRNQINQPTISHCLRPLLFTLLCNLSLRLKGAMLGPVGGAGKPDFTGKAAENARRSP